MAELTREQVVELVDATIAHLPGVTVSKRGRARAIRFAVEAGNIRRELARRKAVFDAIKHALRPSMERASRKRALVHG